MEGRKRNIWESAIRGKTGVKSRVFVSFVPCYQATSWMLTDTEQLASNETESHFSLFSRGFVHLVHQTWSICGLLKGNVRWTSTIRSKPEYLIEHHREKKPWSPHWNTQEKKSVTKSSWAMLNANHYSSDEIMGFVHVWEEWGRIRPPLLCPASGESLKLTKHNENPLIYESDCCC